MERKNKRIYIYELLEFEGELDSGEKNGFGKEYYDTRLYMKMNI